MALELEFQRALAALKGHPKVQNKIAKRRARGDSIPTIYFTEEEVNSKGFRKRLQSALTGAAGLKSSSRKGAKRKAVRSPAKKRSVKRLRGR